MIEGTANLATAVFGLLAAYFWWRVAIEETPAIKAATADMIDFDWLTKPLAAQVQDASTKLAYQPFGRLRSHLPLLWSRSRSENWLLRQRKT